MVQWFKDLVLSLQWLRSLLCVGAIPRLGTSTYHVHSQKKKITNHQPPECLVCYSPEGHASTKCQLWVQISAPTSCVTLGKLLNLSVPQLLISSSDTDLPHWGDVRTEMN